MNDVIINLKILVSTVDVVIALQVTTQFATLLEMLVTNVTVKIQECLFMVRTIVTRSQFPRTSNWLQVGTEYWYW